MVQADLVGRKIARASAWLDDAEPILALSPSAFLDSGKDRDVAAFYVFLALQECIDIAAHWLSDEGWSAPDDAASSFDVLADRGVIARDEALGMRKAVGLRNRIAHGYASLDHARFHAESKSGLTVVRRFLRAAADAAGV